MEPDPAIALHSEFDPVGFQLYLLDLQNAFGTEEAETGGALALVVMTRRDGLLLALPELTLTMDVLEEGNAEGAQGLVGPSIRLEVACAVVDEEALTRVSSLAEGRTMVVVMVDFTNEILPHLKRLTSKEDLEAAHAFDVLEPYLVPVGDELVAKALTWAEGGTGSSLAVLLSRGRSIHTSSTSAEAHFQTKRARSWYWWRRCSKAPKEETDRWPACRQPRDDRPDPASYHNSAARLDSEDRSDRAGGYDCGRQTISLENALRPLSFDWICKSLNSCGDAQGDAATEKYAALSEYCSGEFFSGRNRGVGERVCGGPDIQRFSSSSDGTIKSTHSTCASDRIKLWRPLQDLGGVSTSLSSKGSMGRAKLQNELAAHKGTFYVQVLQSMSRRMYPAMNAEVELSALRDRGVTPTQYLERYGGYGRTRDVGMIIWQVANVMNHMQEGNHKAAMDAISLLFVCLEQTSLDAGNMQVGMLLSLTEEPPATLFSARSVANTMHPRLFAPTACQRWVTTALQYLKEMDVISSRRQEINANKPSQTRGDSEPSSKAAPKKKQKGKGKGKANQESQNQEEEA